MLEVTTKEVETIGELKQWLALLADNQRIRVDIEFLSEIDLNNCAMLQLAHFIKFDDALAGAAKECWLKRYGHEYPRYGSLEGQTHYEPSSNP